MLPKKRGMAATRSIRQWTCGADASALQETLLFLMLMMAFDAVGEWRTSSSVGKERLGFSLLYPAHVLLFSLIRVWALLTCKREVWSSN